MASAMAGPSCGRRTERCSARSARRLSSVGTHGSTQPEGNEQMRIGFTTMNTPEEIRADVLGRALEARGFDSLWIGEHSHIPVSRRTPYPAGGEMPEPY